MRTTKPPLLTRLRRHVATSAWLWLFLVLAKTTLAATCQLDGLQASTVLDMTDSRVLVADASPSLDVPMMTEPRENDGNGPCWHAGYGGCHCHCAHSSLVPQAAWAWTAFPLASSAFPPALTSLLPSVSSTALRPPIA